MITLPTFLYSKLGRFDGVVRLRCMFVARDGVPRKIQGISVWALYYDLRTNDRTVSIPKKDR